MSGNSPQDANHRLPQHSTPSPNLGDAWPVDGGIEQMYLTMYHNQQPLLPHEQVPIGHNNSLALSFTPPSTSRHQSRSPEQGPSNPSPLEPFFGYDGMSHGPLEALIPQWRMMLPLTGSAPTTSYSHNSSPNSFISNPGPNQVQTLQLSPSSPYSLASPSSSQHSPLLQQGSSSPSSTSEGYIQLPTAGDGYSPHNNTPVLNDAPPRRLYTHRDQIQWWKDVQSQFGVPRELFVPQQMYRPHTHSDRRRYVEEVELEAPIYFQTQDGFGIPLTDVLHSRIKQLLFREDTVFHGRGPSVSIRLEWPGYGQWSRQIPTKDFRSPPGPITRAKLAKNIAKCVQRFIDEHKDRAMEEEADHRWKVGPGRNEIKLEDLILISLHHVSMGSWQPHLSLRSRLF